MATMKKFRVVLEVTINDDETRAPDEWDWDDILKGNYTALDSDYGEVAGIVSQEILCEWESDEDDEDDEPSCAFSEGDRVKIVASTHEILDQNRRIDELIEAARWAGKTGEVIGTDPGNEPEVLVRLPNGEEEWMNEDHLVMAE